MPFDLVQKVSVSMNKYEIMNCKFFNKIILGVLLIQMPSCYTFLFTNMVG